MNQPVDAVTMILELQGDQPLTLNCLAVQYKAQIHAPYELKVQIAAADFDFIDKTPCVVKVTSAHFQSFCFSGQLNGLAENQTMNLQGGLRWLTIVPDCSILYQQQRSGMYYDASILDVIERGLKSVSVQQNLSAPESLAYPRQKSMTQYAESDMDFIARQLAEYGIWYNFYQDFETDSGATMMLGDHNQAFVDRGNVNILSDAASEGTGLFNVEWNAVALPDAVTGVHFVEDENTYLTSGQTGLQHHTLGNQLNQKQLDYLIGVVKAGIQVQQQVLTASFQGLNLQAGEVIHIDCDNPPIAFVITEVHYDFSGTHSLKAAALLDLEGKALTYRTPIWVDSQRVYPLPEFTGMLSGCYGLTEGAVVVPDALGNIPVSFPYDYAECCGNQIPARLTRMASWSSQGGQTGKTFPIYKDTELQVMFANGNLDYPIIKGASANAETGHVHNASVNRRTHWQLPQGQHLSYSNVPGDDNFIHLGAEHAEGADRSSMLLTNYRDPDQPGTKRLDYQQSTTQSMERVTGQDYHSQQGGNLTVLDAAAKANPMTYIVIQLTDQTNFATPDKAPALKAYLKTLLIDLSLAKQGQDTPIEVSGLSVNPTQKFKLQQVLEPNVQADKLSQYGALSLSLTHSSASSASQSDAVNVIVQNGQAILPTNTLTLPPASWQKNKTTDQWGNIYYTITLTVLAPPMLFNFRQDVYFAQKKLTGDDLTTYQALSPYFTPDTDSLAAAPALREALTEDELDYFMTQGNNVTLFIHGYNVGFGAWPIAFTPAADHSLTPNPKQRMTLYQDDAYFATSCPAVTADTLSALNIDQRYGTAAHKWLLAMEQHLNQAFGWGSNTDFTKYQRLIGIAWQGNPSTIDYMAAAGNTDFAAQKTFALIQQLHAQGIKIELLAHSLGNGVLAKALSLCGDAGITITHAHLWQPAIPDNSLDTEAHDYLPITLSGTPIPAANYDFTHAQQGAEAITVLFSDNDTILGQVPSEQARLNADPASFTALFEDLPALAYSWIKNAKTEDHVYLRTLLDPGAGLAFMAPAAAVALMDQAVFPIAGIHEKAMSIYHLANLYRYPASLIFKSDLPTLRNYYQTWRSKWQLIDVPYKNSIPAPPINMAATLEQQMSWLSAQIPDLFNFVSIICHLCLHPNAVDLDNLNRYFAQPDTATQAQSFGAKLKQALIEAGHILSGQAILSTLEKLGGIFMEDDLSTLLATMILTGLLTPGAVPRGAMGYDPKNTYAKLFSGHVNPVDQGSLLPDHSGMLFPTERFFSEIYKQQLFSGSAGVHINYFGKWRPA